MPLWCSPPEFKANDKVVSLVSHPPEVNPGTKATIVAPHTGALYAVQLPDGQLHRWFAGFELDQMNPGNIQGSLMPPGSSAKVISTKGHPPHIKIGTIVRIVKALEVPFYDLMIEDKKYHRWLADFELVPRDVVSY